MLDKRSLYPAWLINDDDKLGKNNEKKSKPNILREKHLYFSYISGTLSLNYTLFI